MKQMNALLEPKAWGAREAGTALASQNHLGAHQRELRPAVAIRRLKIVSDAPSTVRPQT